MNQKAEQRLTAVSLLPLLLWHVRREMQFSSQYIAALNSLICLPFLQQYLHLVNNLGRGAIEVVRQNKVIMNLLKCIKEQECEIGEEKGKKKNVPRVHFTA